MNTSTRSSNFLTRLLSPRRKKIAGWFLIALTLISALGFWGLPPLVKWLVQDRLSSALHRPVTLESLRINPYAMSLTLENFSVEEPDQNGALAHFDLLFVKLNAPSLLQGALVVSELRLQNPKINLVRLTADRYNVSDLIDEFLAKPKNDDPLPVFSLKNIQLTGGAIVFDDRPNKKTHEINEINFAIPFISTSAHKVESVVEPSFSAKIAGSPLVLQGKSKPFANSLESEITLNLSDFPFAQYLDYLPISLPVQARSGALDAHLMFSFRQEKDKPSHLLLTGDTSLKNIELADLSGAPLLSVKQLDLTIDAADLLERSFDIRKVALDTPLIHAKVNTSGAVNWLESFNKLQSTPSKNSKKVADNKAAPPLKWKLGEVKVTRGAIRWLDESNGKPFNASLDALELTLKNLAGASKKPASFEMSGKLLAEEWLALDHFSLKGGTLDLARRELSVQEIISQDVRALLRRTAGEKIEWLKPPTLRLIEATQQKNAAQESGEWKVSIKQYVGNNVKLRFEDEAVSPKVTQQIDDLNFEISNISTEKDATAHIFSRFRLNQKSSAVVGGSVTLFPLRTDLGFDIKNVDLQSWLPYFANKLSFVINKGELSINGALKLAMHENSSVPAGTSGGFSGRFTGQTTLANFNATDKFNAAEFLRWKSLYLGAVDLPFQPGAVSIGEVALSDFFARLIINPQGKLNLMQILRPKEEAVAVTSETTSAVESPVAVENTTATTPPQWPFKIGKITLQGGQIRLSDNFVKPNYSANLSEVGGRITDLSSAADSLASVELRGRYDKVAPITLTGKINPFAAPPSLDLQAEVKGVELPPFPAYAKKYAGYAIEQGKLSLKVTYKVEKGQLRAENRIFLDQLSFGEPVEGGSEVSKLPVLLALKLLKNGRGEIDLEIPISGSLDDPQFDLGALVSKAVSNLFLKTLAAPFTLIGSLFEGGGGELANVDFEHGRFALTPEAEKRLEHLAQTLKERPSLNLEMSARVDVARDSEGLKTARLERKLKVLKREDRTSRSESTGSSEQLSLTPEEYPDLLTRVYEAENFPKPRNVLGLVKTLPVEEMEKLILTNSLVGEEDLRRLAERRTRAVRDYLLAHAVPAEQMFLRPHKLIESESGQSAEQTNSRVDFTLK